MEPKKSPGFAWYDGLPEGFERKFSYLDAARRSASWFVHRLPSRTETLSDHSTDPVLSLEMNSLGVVEREIEGRWEKAELTGDNVTFTPAFATCNWLWYGEPLEIIDVYIPYELMQSVWHENFRGDVGNVNLSPSLEFVDESMNQLIRSLVASTIPHHSSPALLRETLTQSILINLLGRTGTTTGSKAATQSMLPHPALRRVCQFIEDELHEDIGLDELTAIAGTSKSHFLRQFRNRMGITPYAYLTDRRMARAKELLAGSTMQISEIAARCGYNEAAHFADRFRKHHRVSPREFRKISR